MTDDVGRLYQRHFEASTWSCGHVAGSCCAECYRELARRATELAAENERLRDALDDELTQKIELLERLKCRP